MFLLLFPTGCDLNNDSGDGSNYGGEGDKGSGGSGGGGGNNGGGSGGGGGNNGGGGNGGGGGASVEVTMKAIAAGSYHSIALSDDGKVYATGYNSTGQLGLGDTAQQRAFTEVNSSQLVGKTITAIAAGNAHSLALSNDDKVYATGNNNAGQLGLNDNTDKDEFEIVSSLSGKTITAIVAGADHSLALSSEGKVYATGEGYCGQLGLGNYDTKNTFTEVSSLASKTITAIAAGYQHSLALSNDGNVYATGRNDYGQLGLNDTTDKDEFEIVSSLSGKTITAIVAGAYHSLALSNDGKVYVAGHNVYGQLGLGDTTDQKTFTEVNSSQLVGKTITAIVAGGYHSLALSRNGKVYATGYNVVGQLGLGDTTNKNTFTEVNSSQLVDKNITAIAAGAYHSFALSSDGNVYATGLNSAGQLGLGDTTNRNTFTLVPPIYK